MDRLKAWLEKAPPQHQLRVFRAFLFLLGFGLALLAVLVIWDNQSLVEQSDDPFRFANIGQNAAEGRGFYNDRGPDLAPEYVRRGPTYPAFIALLYLIGGPHPILIQLAQCVLVGVAAILVFEIGRIAFNLRTARIAGTVYACHPMILRYSPDIQVEVLLITLTLTAVWLSLRFCERPSIGYGVAFGVVGAAAAMTKAVALPYMAMFLPAYVLFNYLKSRREGEKTLRVPWLPLAAIPLAMALVILPYSYRNYQVLDGKKFVLISAHASGEFLRGYIFAESEYLLLQESATQHAEARANQMEIDLFAAQGKVWMENEVETEEVLNRAAKEKLLSDPLAFIRKISSTFFMFWYVATTRGNSLFILAMSLTTWALAFVGIRRAWREKRPIWQLVLPILTWNFTYAALVALARYSAPVVPLVTLLAAYGVDSLLRTRSKESQESAVVPS